LKFKIAVGAAILSVIGLGISSAAIPDSATGVITACRSSIGQLKVIDKQAGASCSVYGETEMSWNQSGPAGATGATGPQGPAGVAGSSGITGYETVENAASNFYLFSGGEAQAQCPTGKKILGGSGWASFSNGSGGGGVIVTRAFVLGDNRMALSIPAPTEGGWTTWSVKAICAYVS
jgi:hypothetical protein